MDHKKDIETLLDLNGQIISQAGGYWTKFEARKLPIVTDEIPHGIRYSLTLHDRHGKRIMGFDNAHPVKSGKKGKYHGRKTHDHRHRHSEDNGVPYEFIDAHELLKDFWSEVDRILRSLGLDTEN